jgi:hypothetical protein
MKNRIVVFVITIFIISITPLASVQLTGQQTVMMKSYVMKFSDHICPYNKQSTPQTRRKNCVH